jgi:lipoyl(octanoyl) transferase
MSMRRRLSSYSIATFVLLWFVAETSSFVAINPPPPHHHHTESCRRATAANDKLTLSHLFLAPQQLGSFQELIVPSEEQDERRVALYDWSAHETIPFVAAWDFQKKIVDGHLERLSSSRDSSCQFLTSTSSHGKDCVLFLQHDPVYTLGTASDPGFIRSDQVHMVDVVRMDRGGEVTYHGPGQLVVYPILDLRGYNQDIHWYMRALEEAVLYAIELAGIETAVRQDDVTGVWIHDHKVAAVGIKARRWITMHGLAVNVEETSLQNFEGIVPCGLQGRNVGCVNDFLDEPITVPQFSKYMKEALEYVFRVRLEEFESEFL